MTGAGTVVTGTLVGGALHVGDDVTIAPAGTTARIRAIEMLGEPSDAAPPGSRVALNLAGGDTNRLQRGDAVLDSSAPWCTTAAALVELRALPGEQLEARGAWAVHTGTAKTAARLHPLLGRIDGPGVGFAHLELDAPLPLQHGDRVVVRDVGRSVTVAGGRVLDPLPGPRPRGTEARLRCATLAEQLASGEPAAVARGLVGLRGGVAPRVEVIARAGPSATTDVRQLVSLPDHVAEREVVDRWRAAVVDAVSAAPVGGAAVDAAVGGLVTDGCPEAVAPVVVRSLTNDGTLFRHRTTLVRATDATALLDRRRRRADTLLERLRAAGAQPPPAGVLAAELQVAHDDIGELVAAGRLVRGGDLLFAVTALDEAANVLRRSFAGPFTAAEARTALGLSRRHAIPLLEALRASGATSFDGQVHRTVAAGDKQQQPLDSEQT